MAKNHNKHKITTLVLKDQVLEKTESLGTMIGSGEFGSVWSLSNPNEVLKVSFLKTKSDRDSFDREVYYLKFLNTKLPGLTPKLRKSTISSDNKVGYQIMERFDSSFKDLGLSQSVARGLSKGSRLFSWSQIEQAIQLATKLDRLGIVHGDAKLANILYRMLGPRLHIVWSDFGFSGCIDSKVFSPLNGFTTNYGSSSAVVFQQGKAKLCKPIPDAILPYFNRLQIYTDLMQGRTTYMETKNSKKNIQKFDEKIRFLLQLPKCTFQQMGRFCKEFKVPLISDPSPSLSSNTK